MKKKNASSTQEVLDEVDTKIKQLLKKAGRATFQAKPVAVRRNILYGNVVLVLGIAVRKLNQKKRSNQDEQEAGVLLTRYLMHLQKKSGQELGILEVYGLTIAIKIIMDNEFGPYLTRAQMAKIEGYIGTPAFPPKFDLW